MKTIKKSNYRVEVYPKTKIYGIQISEEKNICAEIVKDIERHVNDVQSVHIVCDNEPVCSYCGYAWEADGDKWNGGCCEKDDENKTE